MLKAIDKWLLPYLRRPRRRDPDRPVHLVIAVCDHYEPFHDTDLAGALSRVASWREGFLQLAGTFSDSDGQPPKHTFFYPVEQYHEDVVSRIAALCRETGSEGGIHLHHDNDRPETLEQALMTGARRLREHGLIGPDERFPFIHGDWALDNSHPHGRFCGVSGELGILRRTGCYADFTMPSAPSPTQTRTINSIYYATSGSRPKSHDRGVPAGPATASFRNDPSKLLLVQGPLGLNWRRRKFGVLPRVENADLTGANPPVASRLRLWRTIAPDVTGRADVVFVKLHTHGAVESNSAALLGEPMKSFHRHLADSGTPYHYVTAREMVNLIHAFEDGRTGPPGEYRDYLFPRPLP